MIARLTLMIGCWTLCSQAPRARQIRWSYDAIVDSSGEPTHRDILVDTDRRTVADNTMLWTDGSESRAARDLEESVHIEDNGRVLWGNRQKRGGAALGVFSLDLRSGAYAFTDAIAGQLSHGTCTARTTTS